MNITVQTSVAKPVAQVWEVMGTQFGHAHRWSSNFKTSKPGGPARFAGIDHSLRDTTTDRGNTIQELTHFDAEQHTLTYIITQGAPEIAKSAGATWSLQAQGQQSTQLTMEFVMEPKMPLPADMEAKVRMGLTAAVNTLAQELKYYLEEGTPHPNNASKTQATSN